jgi:hypothetical protein
MGPIHDTAIRPHTAPVTAASGIALRVHESVAATSANRRPAPLRWRGRAVARPRSDVVSGWAPTEASVRAIAEHFALHFGPTTTFQVHVETLDEPHLPRIRSLHAPDGVVHLGTDVDRTGTPVRCTFVSSAGEMTAVTCPRPGAIVFRQQQLWCVDEPGPWWSFAVIATACR